MESQKEQLLRRITDMEALVKRREVDIAESEKLLSDLQSEIVTLKARIDET